MDFVQVFPELLEEHLSCRCHTELFHQGFPTFFFGWTLRHFLYLGDLDVLGDEEALRALGLVEVAITHL